MTTCLELPDNSSNVVIRSNGVALTSPRKCCMSPKTPRNASSLNFKENENFHVHIVQANIHLF